MLRLPVVLDHRCFDRDTCTKYAIQCDERFGSCDQDLGEGRRLLVVRKGGACEWEENLTTIRVVPYLIILPISSSLQPYVRQMSQKAHNPTPPAELSNSPMLNGPTRTESEEPGSGDGNKNKDDLYLFTRGQVFRKSSQRSSAPFRSSSFPGPSSDIQKLPAQSFSSYPESGFNTPGLTLFHGQQDGYPSYPCHGNGHGYHSSSSTPGIPTSLVPSLDMFPLENADQLSMFASATNGATAVDGVDSVGSSSWLQQFGIPDGPPIGFGR